MNIINPSVATDKQRNISSQVSEFKDKTAT